MTKILPIKEYKSYNSINSKDTGFSKTSVSFGSIHRVLKNGFTETVINRNNSWMRREDINWKQLVEDIIRTGKKIFCYACSDGSEPYTLAMQIAQKTGLDEVPKRFKIKAKDIDTEVIKAAKSGYIAMTKADIVHIGILGRSFKKLFKRAYFHKSNTIADISVGLASPQNPSVINFPSSKILNSQTINRDKIRQLFTSLERDEDFEKFLEQIYNPNKTIIKQQELDAKLYKVDKRLRACIDFQVGDLTQDIDRLNLDNAVLMFRNALPYNPYEQRINIINKISDKATYSTLLVMGEFDKTNALPSGVLGFEKFMQSSGFEEIYRNIYSKK